MSSVFKFLFPFNFFVNFVTDIIQWVPYFQAEIIPLEPDPDNAGEGKGFRISFFYLPIALLNYKSNRNETLLLTILVAMSVTSSMAQFSLSGKITTTEGRPLEGANVIC